jgi:bis(5'-nucleosyl)-tetraphosphatase (symmetrical)
MATYAIGDVQGCSNTLQRLLERIRFEPAVDRVWFTGDLVNRGPDSVGVLRLIKSFGESAIAVLGNHDLHLLALACGAANKKERDTLDDVLAAPDADTLLAWLRTRPLLHHDSAISYTLIHAGLLPQWNLAQTQTYARAVEANVARNDANFFRALYGNLPARWDDELAEPARSRVIVNALTRLRYCDADGNMDLQQKGPLGSQAAGLFPWFKNPRRRTRDQRIVFGHWSALGLYCDDNVVGLDTGCAWGRTLTAARLDSEPPEFTSVPCSDVLNDDER